MAEKRYYWLKLRKDFFNDIAVKKLRRIAGGDTLTIIYLKLILYTIDTDGVVVYQGVEPTIGDEIALGIDEDPDNVGLCLNYLVSVGLAEGNSERVVFPEVAASVGSESAAAQRVRSYRERHKALHCNSDVTEVKRLCNVEKDIDKEIDKEIEIYISSDSDIKKEWFEQWWKLYPRKTGKAKCKMKFLKVCTSEEMFNAMLEKLKEQIDVVYSKREMKFIPLPETYLNQGRWEDEVSPDNSKPLTSEDEELLRSIEEF